MGVDRKPAWFDDKSGPVAKWIRRRFPTPEIAGSSPARVDQKFSIFLKICIYTNFELETVFSPLERNCCDLKVIDTKISDVSMLQYSADHCLVNLG